MKRVDGIDCNFFLMKDYILSEEKQFIKLSVWYNSS